MNIDVINFGTVMSGNVLVKIISWLVQITSSVVLGVVLFTVLLKLITLPFDYISRSSMRKNSIKMEEMRPELERLQRQYAGNKDLYNQKMMALYKKNGYSMFGACLPTIITLVIFIVAINAFTNYSKFQNLEYYKNMSNAYNAVIYSGLEENEYIKVEDGKLVINEEYLIENGSVGNINVDKSDNKLKVDTGSFLIYERDIVDGVPSGGITLKINKEKLDESGLTLDGKIYSEYALGSEEDLSRDFIERIASNAAAESYRSNKCGFLWIKNIWVPDTSFKHPVEKDFNSFNTTYSYEHKKDKFVKGGELNSETYQLLIRDLGPEQTKPNGYYILVLLTAGMSLLSQIVLSKGQKAQMELQTVDGQGAQQQKTMTIMMPIIMAIFSFMYTAAFSIYIVLNSAITIGTTFGINAIVDSSVKKAKKKEGSVSHKRFYVKKEEEVKEEPKKKKEEIVEHDFLSGLADVKNHPRGRIK